MSEPAQLPLRIRHAVEGKAVIVAAHPRILRATFDDDMRLLIQAGVEPKRYSVATGLIKMLFSSGGRIDYLSSREVDDFRGRSADFVAGDLSLNQAYFLTANSSLPNGQRF